MTAKAPAKDEDASHRIPDQWRPTLREVVKALAEGDYELSRGIPSVAMQKEVAEQILAYVTDYGETLVELPDDTWQSSVSQWMETHWDILVDLWTAEAGESDLVLSVRVFESNGGYRFEIDSLHVP